MLEDWKPFAPDAHTVALYHFDEGQGNEAHDACRDPELTLRAHKEALWGRRTGFGSTARFTRRGDDGNVLVGPANNDKLHLATCTEAWTIEAWVKYTGPYGRDWTNTVANIASTDDEGVNLQHGYRGGWHFYLHNVRHFKEDGLSVMPRFIGHLPAPDERGRWYKGDEFGLPVRVDGYTGVVPATFVDQQWHHVAWQFRHKDQLHTTFLDGRLIWRGYGQQGREVANDYRRPVYTPFTVGGWIHSTDPPVTIVKWAPFDKDVGNFVGEIDELRISSVLRYPVADRLSIVRHKLPPAGWKQPYSEQLSADVAQGQVAWQLVAGTLPQGLTLDRTTGVISGTPGHAVENAALTISATDSSSQTDTHNLTMAVRRGHITNQWPHGSLPLGFAGLDYAHELRVEHMVEPVTWTLVEGALPQGIKLDRRCGRFSGKHPHATRAEIRVQAADALGQRDERDLVLDIVPAALCSIGPDQHTVVLYNWQGPSGRDIPDVMGDPALTLQWVNTPGDMRMPRPGWGVYPHDQAGEWGFSGPQHNDKLDLRTCGKQWTVEAWVRRGGDVNMYDMRFDYGHICGTYDNTERGVWELYLSEHESPDGSMAPGVHFFGAQPDQALKDLHPWKRPAGLVVQPELAGIDDVEWHHVAWQYDAEGDLHELLLDGRLIWKMASPDGRRLVNNRRHDAQFSVLTRLSGYARFGGGFNWRGFGNFFGQIGEIRISDTRRY